MYIRKISMKNKENEMHNVYCTTMYIVHSCTKYFLK